MKLGVRTETDYSGRPCPVVFDHKTGEALEYVRSCTFDSGVDRVTTVTVTFYPVNEHGQICGPTAEQEL